MCPLALPLDTLYLVCMETQRRRKVWSREAACHGVYNNRDIKQLCGDCPVLAECLNYAVVHEQYGYWGGTNETERREVRNRTLETLGYQAVSEGWLESESLLTDNQVAEFRALASTEQSKVQQDDRPTETPEEIQETLAQVYSLEFDFSVPPLALGM